MNEQFNEQTTINSQFEESKEKVGEEKKEVSLGKFKDVNALLNAYNSLEAEFTKRCQKIKELESTIGADKTTVPAKVEDGKELEEEKVGISEKDKEDILKDYLKQLLSSKSKAIIMDGTGVGVSLPPSKPKTLEQARNLACEILK